MKIQIPPGATLLDDETLQGLIPGLITQGELDEFEAANIAKAILWAGRSREIKKNLLTASGLRLLHLKMFEDTWKWAGEFRKRQTNIGVPPAHVLNDLGILLGDMEYWLKNKTYSYEEMAIRFHHRLVWIHPFPNGNGRFSRLATDLFLEHQGVQQFAWGRKNLGQVGQKREEYIYSLRRADRENDYSALLNFVKS